MPTRRRVTKKRRKPIKKLRTTKKQAEYWEKYFDKITENLSTSFERSKRRQEKTMTQEQLRNSFPKPGPRIKLGPLTLWFHIRPVIWDPALVFKGIHIAWRGEWKYYFAFEDFRFHTSKYIFCGSGNRTLNDDIKTEGL